MGRLFTIIFTPETAALPTNLSMAAPQAHEPICLTENHNILFDEVTKELLNFLIMSNKVKFILILTEQNMNVLLQLAKFIVKAWG